MNDFAETLSGGSTSYLKRVDDFIDTTLGELRNGEPFEGDTAMLGFIVEVLGELSYTDDQRKLIMARLIQRLAKAVELGNG